MNTDVQNFSHRKGSFQTVFMQPRLTQSPSNFLLISANLSFLVYNMNYFYRIKILLANSFSW